VSGRIVVYHSGYGCDTGCCGHSIEVEGSGRDRFVFEHPDSGEDMREFAEGLVRSEFGEAHVADLDWDSCFISED
jgi:hypothetical protein